MKFIEIAKWQVYCLWDIFIGLKGDISIKNYHQHFFITYSNITSEYSWKDQPADTTSDDYFKYNANFSDKFGKTFLLKVKNFGTFLFTSVGLNIVTDLTKYPSINLDGADLNKDTFIKNVYTPSN